MTNIPSCCLQDCLKILTEQNTKDVLIIDNGKIIESNIKKGLNNKKLKIHTVAWGQIMSSLKGSVQVILWNYSNTNTNDDLASTIKYLLKFVSQSVIVTTPLYCAADGSASNMFGGVRFFHPVKFSELDFTFHEYLVPEEQWQIYHFYPQQKWVSMKEDRLDEEIPEKRKLNIVYALPHLNLTGGIKYLILHAKFLQKRGHRVYLMCKDASTALPAWSDIDPHKDVAGQIVISENEDYKSVFQDYNINAVVVGFYTQIEELMDCGVPILYWEQGSELLYGDMGEVKSCNCSKLQQIRHEYRLPVTMAAVSPIVQTILKTKYGRTASLLYTGVDTDFYCPINDDCSKPIKEFPEVLLIGMPQLAFKGFNVIIGALDVLWQRGVRFSVTWATQSEIDIEVPYPVKVVQGASQQQLAELYRNADLLISASTFESFPMPPMEAFASGTAVVSTDNGGIHVYANPGVNILLAEQGNLFELCTAVEYLIENTAARKSIAQNARKDALAFSIERGVDQLEVLLLKMCKNFSYNDKTKKAKHSDFLTKHTPLEGTQKVAQKQRNVTDYRPPHISTLQGYSGLQKMVETGEGVEAVIKFSPSSKIISRLELLTEISRGKNIIHVGCTDHLPLIKYKMANHIWLHGLLTQSCHDLIGIDINQEALNYLNSVGIKNVTYGDITQPDHPQIINKKWDYILFAEMLEHLTDPGGFLQQVRNHYAEFVDQCIVTVPNAFGLPFLAAALNNGEERVNPDHKYWFTPYTLWKILSSAGLKVESLFTCGYENSMRLLKQNEERVLKNPMLQDTIVAICNMK